MRCVQRHQYLAISYGAKGHREGNVGVLALADYSHVRGAAGDGGVLDLEVFDEERDVLDQLHVSGRDALAVHEK